MVKTIIKQAFLLNFLLFSLHADQQEDQKKSQFNTFATGAMTTVGAGVLLWASRGRAAQGLRNLFRPRWQKDMNTLKEEIESLKKAQEGFSQTTREQFSRQETLLGKLQNNVQKVEQQAQKIQHETDGLKNRTIETNHLARNTNQQVTRLTQCVETLGSIIEANKPSIQRWMGQFFNTTKELPKNIKEIGKK